VSLTGPLSRIPPPPSLLQLVENLVFNNQVINLDGYEFKNCAFVDCTLRTSVGNFKLQECFFQGTWWVDFGGRALTITRLASIVDLEGAEPKYKAIAHPNGGVTIL
jgi:hypothetical protein